MAQPYYNGTAGRQLHEQEAAPPQVRTHKLEDVPVFDRRDVPNRVRGAAKTGLASHASDTYGAIGFKRTDTDRRLGKPLPPEATGDPRPDRLEHAERIRLAILEKDNRYRIEGSCPDEELRRHAPRRYAARSSTPDIEKPRSYYIDIAPEDAALEARRGDQVLLFATTSDAVRCLTGTYKDAYNKAIQNAAGGVTKSAFGWEWTRLKSRRGRNR